MIQKTNDKKNQYIKTLIYGESGIGKTYLSGTLDDVLILSIERGLLTLQDKEIDYIDLNTKSDGSLLELKDKYISWVSVVNSLKKKTKYKTIILDSVTELSTQLYGSLLPSYTITKSNGKQHIEISLYNEFFLKMRFLINLLLSLPYNIVVTALPSNEHESSEKRIETYGKMKTILPSLFDEVFYYLLVKDKEGKDHRMLLTQPIEGIFAKDRSSRLNKYELPNLKNIFEKINGISKKE